MLAERVRCHSPPAGERPARTEEESVSGNGSDLVLDYLESLNRRDFAAARAALADDAALVVMGSGDRAESGDAVIESDMAWLTAFPDARLVIDHITSSGDVVVVEYTGSGTHTGPLPTPAGDVAATGRPAMLAFCDVVTVRDGRIAQIREYFDTLALLSQLGLVPDAVAAG